MTKTIERNEGIATRPGSDGFVLGTQGHDGKFVQRDDKLTPRRTLATIVAIVIVSWAVIIALGLHFWG